MEIKQENIVTKSRICKLVENNFTLDRANSGEDKRFYVYGLFYEKKDQKVCFYVGKGTDNRHKIHFRNSSLEERCYNSHKNDKIKKLKKRDKDPYSEILFKNLSENKALDVEEFLLQQNHIFENVTNILRENPPPLSGKDHPMHGKERSPEMLEKMSRISRRKIEKINWLVENSILTNKETARELEVSMDTVIAVKYNNQRSYIDEFTKPEWYDEEYKKEVKQQRREKYSDVSKQEVKEIRWLREETEVTHKQISEKYGYSSGMVCSIAHENILGHINGEKKPSWVDDQFIKSAKRSRENYMSGERNPSNVLPDKKVKEIKWLLNNTDLTHKQIASQYDISFTLISAINLGRARSNIEETKKPEWHSEKKEKEVIQEKRRKFKENSDTVKLTDEDVREIKWLLENTDLYQRVIAEKYNVWSTQVSHIKNERSRSDVDGTKKPDWFESEESCTVLT